jgi:hypothetical protein
MSILSELLTIPMDYSTFKNSYSPLFSSYALCLDGKFPGITKLVLNYNRKARALWSPLVKLPGDFMLTETFLRNKFSIKGNRVIFPTREEGILLSRFRPDPSEPVLALTTRDELISSAYAVSGARALRQSTRLGVAIHLLGGILGMIIMLALGYLGSTQLLTPTNVLLYQLIWAIPGLLVTEWTRVV